MKVVLVVLSGDSRRALAKLQEKYPDASQQVISRSQIEEGSFTSRLSRLRALHPAVLAIATERLAWQRGQDALLLFGALAGAERTIIFDAYDGWREELRRQSLTSAPARLLSETAVSRKAMARAARDLRELESAVDRLDIGAGRANPEHPPRIVYLRTTPGPGTQLGGAASHINGFINAVEQLGATVSVVTNDEIAGLDRAKSVKIIRPQAIGSSRAAFDILNNQLFTEKATVEIAKQEPDLIYQRYSRFSWAGVDASVKTGLPLFLEYNGSEVWMAQHWDRAGKVSLLERFERLNLRAAARIFVVAKVERANLLSAGVPDEKIVVNVNGVDPNKFHPGVGGAEVRQKLGLGSETLVGFVGTFGPWHGVLALAEAIGLVPPKENVRFLLVGSGALRDEVVRILRESGSEERVIFTGAVAHEEVPALLDACDVLVSPHVPLADGKAFFGSPTKLFEYMAMGKGIVASKLGQIGEVLVHEETALLVKPGDAHELSDAIVRLSSSQELRERLGAAARNAAIANHTWTNNAQRVLDAYRQLMLSSAPPK